MSTDDSAFAVSSAPAILHVSSAMPSIVTNVTVAWSVRLSVCVSYSCTLRKPLNGIKCSLAETLLKR